MVRISGDKTALNELMLLKGYFAISDFQTDPLLATKQKIKK